MGAIQHASRGRCRIYRRVPTRLLASPRSSRRQLIAEPVAGDSIRSCRFRGGFVSLAQDQLAIARERQAVLLAPVSNDDLTMSCQEFPRVDFARGRRIGRWLVRV